jgi:hypothetical protein
MTNTFNNGFAANVSASATLIYTASNNTVVLQLDLCNITNGARQATVWINSGGTPYRLAFQTSVPVGDTLQVVYGQKIVLKNGDKIYAQADTSNAFDVVLSVLENVG